MPSVKVRIKTVKGAVFKPGAIADAIRTATRETLDYGQAIIQSITPIDTGLLQASWETESGRNESSIYDEVPYAPFVEEGTSRMAGRFMAARSVPAIADYLEDRLNKEIEKLK